MTAPTESRTTTLRRAATVGLWVLQAALAVQFAGAGIMKLAGQEQMVDLFTDVGAGQWLRYLVGVVEVAGAIGLLIPRLAGLAALGLVALMVGAIVTNVFVIDANPALPIVILLAAGLVAWVRRAEIRALR